MKKPKKINLFSSAIFHTVLFAAAGFICGILYSFGGALHDAFVVGSVNVGTALAFMALIGMPIAFGIIGFVFGFVEAILYNLFAKWFVGLKIDFE